MSLRNWFGNVKEEEPTRQEQRAEARLCVHAQVLVCGDTQTSDDRLETADLVNLASGGLRLRMDNEVEVGQTLWIRTTVTHVSRHNLSADIGVSWDKGRSIASALPLPVSNEALTQNPAPGDPPVTAVALRSTDPFSSLE